VLLTGLLLLTSLLLARATQDTATITARVTDASDAVVPRATVTVTNVATSIEVRVATDDAGLYTATSLRRGNRPAHATFT
jgi:hypothetical protein